MHYYLILILILILHALYSTGRCGVVSNKDLHLGSANLKKKKLAANV